MTTRPTQRRKTGPTAQPRRPAPSRSPKASGQAAARAASDPWATGSENPGSGLTVGGTEDAATPRVPSGGRWLAALTAAVEGLGYELVDVERLPRGLMRVSIDRVPGRAYPIESEFVTVDDCELVTRQLQLLLEVETVAYERLEVSSPGLDRPLRKPSDWLRFIGHEVDVTFRLPFEGRRKFRGLLTQAEPSPRLVVRLGPADQALDFTLDEVREARLVPVVDFKGRGKGARNGEQEP